MKLQLSNVLLKNAPNLPITIPINANVANTQPTSERRSAVIAKGNS